MQDFADYLIFIATVGIISLTVPMLCVRSKVSQAYIMLSLFLCCGALANILPLLIEVRPSLQRYSLAIVVPAYILQPVFLWLYVKGLCSPTRWVLSQTPKKHLILPVISLVFAIAALLLPAKDMLAIVDGEDQVTSNLGVGFMVATFVMMLLWGVQSSVYLKLIVERLLSYRRELKQLFTSNDRVELGWLLAVIGVIALAWCISVIYLVMSFTDLGHELETQVLSACYFVLVWVLSFWGLRQKPGFHNRYLSHVDQALQEVIDVTAVPESSKKYSRSGLDHVMCQKIAEKIETAMRFNKLYLNSALSLGLLAKELSIQANYVSQVLNQVLERTFFDYVNSWRVTHSKPLIILGEDSVLDIALASGFNSKSSFYKAFRKETGQTPTQYRLHEQSKLAEGV